MKIDDLTSDRILTDDEETELKNLSSEFGLSLSDFPELHSTVETVRRLTRINKGELPTVSNPSILLKKGEVCFAELPVSLQEMRTRTVYQGRTEAVSFRIAKGVRYTVGGFRGEPITHQELKQIDTGTICITSERIVFTGLHKAVTYPIKKLVNFNRYADAVQFMKENEAKPKWFVSDDKLVIEEVCILTSRVCQL